MPRGIKTCPTCNKTMGPRTLSCVCGHTFMQGKNEKTVKLDQGTIRKTKKQRATSVANFKELRPGDKIKVAGGGSYYLNREGVKIRIGYKGRFIVNAVDHNGIYAYGNKKEGEQSMCYIWMGRNLLSKAGVHRRAHKVVKING